MSPQRLAALSASDLEKQWYSLCNGSEFIDQVTVERYTAALHAQGEDVAIVVGLSDFTGYTCPRCSGAGQFKIHFLGSLKHAQCGWTGYMNTGHYIGQQISQIFHSGIRAGGSMKDQADKKGDRSQGWVNMIFGFLFVGLFRACLAVVLIPVHALVALFQNHQTKTDVVTRVVTIAVMLTAIGVAVYAIRKLPSPAHGKTAGAMVVGNVPDYYGVQVTDNGRPQNQGGAQAIGLLVGIEGKGLKMEGHLSGRDVLGKYALLSFNRPHDIMHLNCPSGYKLVDAKSTGQHKVMTDSDIGMATVEIEPGKQNSLLITCKKK